MPDLLGADRQIEQLKRNPLYEGYLDAAEVVVMVGHTAQRVAEMDALQTRPEDH